AAYRLVVKDARAIVAEVRVFPYEDEHRLPGQWSGVWVGRAKVPSAGLTTRLLRRLRLGHDVHSLPQIVGNLKDQAPQLRHVFDLPVDILLAPPPPRSSAGGRGRPRLPDRQYAELAAAYAAAVARGSTTPI